MRRACAEKAEFNHKRHKEHKVISSEKQEITGDCYMHYGRWLGLKGQMVGCAYLSQPI